MQSLIPSSLLTKAENKFLSESEPFFVVDTSQIFYHKRETKVAFFLNNTLVSFYFPYRNARDFFLIESIHKSCVKNSHEELSSIKIHDCSIRRKRIYSTVLLEGKGQHFVCEYLGEYTEFYLTSEEICRASVTKTFEECFNFALRFCEDSEEKYTLPIKSKRFVWSLDKLSLTVEIKGGYFSVDLKHEYSIYPEWGYDYPISDGIWPQVYTPSTCEMILRGNLKK